MEENKKPELALRYNTGKRKWALLDYESLEPLVDVLEYGAKKYTKKIELSIKNINEICQKLEYASYAITVKELSLEECVHLVTINPKDPFLHVNLVEMIDKLKVKDYVHPVMKQKDSKILQSLMKKEKNTTENISIDQKIKLEKKNEVLEEEINQDLKKKEKEVNSSEEYQNMGLVKIFTISNVNEVVKYVEARKGYTLITVIQQEDLEAFFVVNAIKELDCLETTLTILEMLSCISKPVYLNNDIIIPGEFNWKKGHPTTELCESLLRHTYSFLNGEDNDEESGCSLIGHIMTYAMFLSYVMKHKPELDTRYKEKNK